MKRHHGLWICAAVGAFGFGLGAGCAGPAKPAAPPAAPVGPPATGSPTYLPLDPAAEASLEVPAQVQRRLADGCLDVVADLRNRGPAPVRVEIQCVFFGGTGSSYTLPWQPAVIAVGETWAVHFTAPRPGPALYSIRVRTVKSP
jgi:hypothetical protein